MAKILLARDDRPGMTSDAGAAFLHRHRHAASLIAIGLLSAAMILPFVDKPFHVDDPLFLWTARQIQHHPFDFFGFEVHWQQFPGPMSGEMKNPPLISYFIAGVTAVFGWGEVPLHLAFAGIAIITSAGIYLLANRFTRHPLLASAIAVLSPALAISSTTVMSDVPALCLWIWAMVAWIHAVDRDRPWILPLAGLLVAAGALTKYPGMNLIPLLAAYALMHRRHLLMQIVGLVIPIALLIAYQIWTSHLYGKGLLTDAAGFASAHWIESPRQFVSRVLICVAFVGGSSVTAALLLPLVLSRSMLITTIVGGAVVAGLAIVVIDAQRVYCGDEQRLQIAYLIELGLMFAGGMGLLTLTISDCRASPDRDALFLALWISGSFAFALLINWSINARTILPMIPAFGMLIGRSIDRIGVSQPSWQAWTGAGLILGAVIAFAVSNADHAEAQAVRRAVDTIMRGAAQRPGKVYFMGHWGFQWYMEARGATSFDPRDTVYRPGDTIVRPLNNYGFFRLPTAAVEPGEPVISPTDPWISVGSSLGGSGFYYAGDALLPFVIGTAPSEGFTMYHVISPFSGRDCPPVN